MEEQEALCVLSKVWIWQWDWLVEQEGLLYRLTYHPAGGAEHFQLLLPQCLKKEVLHSIHNDHGHQGTERTLQVLCFWPNMAQDMERWCQ